MQPGLGDGITVGNGLVQPPSGGLAAFAHSNEEREVGGAAAAGVPGGLHGPTDWALDGESCVWMRVGVHTA